MIPENCFYTDSKNLEKQSESHLFGYAITEDSILFGSKGLREYDLKNGSLTQISEGRFCAILKLTNRTIIKCDSTGQDTIFFYHNINFWAVSNSFLLLANEVSKKFKLNLYGPAVQCFHLKEGFHIGEQLISHKTMIDEIKVLPINSYIEIDKKNSFRVISKPYIEHIGYDYSTPYKELLHETLERGAGMLGAIAEIGPELRLFLSGGYDSRLVLGMLSLNSDYRDKLKVISHKNKIDDFRVAKNICSRLGLELNGFSSPPLKKSSSSSESLLNYFSSCGAVYLPIYPVNSTTQSNDFSFRITGDQPTGWSHFAGNARFNGTSKKIYTDIQEYLKDRPYADQVANDFKSVFHDLQIDLDSPFAMQAYYSAIRGRFHCGRNWYKSKGNDFLFTPLMLNAFINLDLKNSNNGWHPSKIFADSFAAIGDWAIEEPFETESRKFPQKILENLALKGRNSITPRHFRVYGNPCQNYQEPGCHNIPINFSSSQEEIKNHIENLYYRAKSSRESIFFTESDIKSVKKEINKRGALSHDYRKTSHLLSLELTLEIINNSNKHIPINAHVQKNE